MLRPARLLLVGVIDKAQRALRKLKPRGNTSSKAALWTLLLLLLALIGLMMMWQAAVLPHVPAAGPADLLRSKQTLLVDDQLAAVTPLQPIEEDVAALQQRIDAFDPTTAVAFGIPVGGRTKRAAQLGDILSTLIAGGAPAQNIFVLEDVLGRPGAVADPDVARVAQQHGVRVVHSAVSRADMPENSSNFGIHLARHYKFMLDYLLVGPAAAGVASDPAPAPASPAPPALPGSTQAARRSGPPFEFAVLIEDDLVLAPDFVKYFFSMSSVMAADPTLYCVSAHQDNAFFGTSWERVVRDASADAGPDGQGQGQGAVKPASLDPLGFDFRRGNHFMAPGWMTSAQIYKSVVRPRWLDHRGEYLAKDELHLRNGHWDRFFDSLTGQRDCIFPAVPRIAHRGADGFTVSQRAQMELYSNLRLANLPVDTDYGDLARLTRKGYEASTRDFIVQSLRLSAPEESRRFRASKLVLLVAAAKTDKDEAWNALLNGHYGLIGVGGYGGWEGYVKVRGILSGAVFVQWGGNDILLVGAYSPYADLVRQKRFAVEMEATSVGCFTDRGGSDRDLKHHVAYYTAANLSPRACLSSCIHMGFQYAGLQAGMECWCGHEFGRHGAAADPAQCSARCGGAGGTSTDATACGGDWLNSVYWNAAAPQLHVEALAAPSDLAFLAARPGQSCTDACAAASTPRALATGQGYRCAETLFPLLHRTCNILRPLLGCSSCREEEDIARGIYSPGGTAAAACVLSKGRYIRCDAKPPPQERDYRRACVCEVASRGGDVIV